MKIRTYPLPLTKLHPLTISRGTSGSSTSLVVEVEHDGVVGYGEMAPVSAAISGVAETHETASADITRWAGLLEEFSPADIDRIVPLLIEWGGGRAAMGGLDFALHDWWGKSVGRPAYQLLGGSLSTIVPTSLTIGIDIPGIARERTLETLSRLNPKFLKVKLGSPHGIESDKAMMTAVLGATPSGVGVRVDANGGWTVDDALEMMSWLADRGIEYVEQPLPKGQESLLPTLFHGRALPIFADESCCTAKDVTRLAGLVDGVNLKLMKAGGIHEGMRLINEARRHGLKVMMGCMSESSLAIAGSAALSPFADYLDLDSHLNLNPDPFVGLGWSEGRTLPHASAPGLGVQLAS